MNKKGLAISSLVYTILIAFLVLVGSSLALLGTKQVLFEKYKTEVMNILNNR